MFKDKYQNREGKCLRGLGSMRHTGLAWLPCNLFNWPDLHLHDKLVTLTSFTFNGLQGVFRNRKDVNSVSREYCRTRELESRLRTSAPDDHPNIQDHMRKTNPMMMLPEPISGPL